ncbi:MAG: TipAS antibiotic-recognition domain-containing protein [Acutalibacteraceae bacterium]
MQIWSSSLSLTIYTCTPEILAGLGEMYVIDERFRENIDKVGGEGTAAFVSKAIAAYCMESE